MESESEEESVEYVHRRHTISHTKSSRGENERRLDATNTPFPELDEVTVELHCDDPHLGIEIEECSARRRGYICDAKKGSSFANVRGWSRKYRGAYVVQVDNNWTVTPQDVAEQLEIARDKAEAEGRNSIKLTIAPDRVMDKSGASRLYEEQMIAQLKEQLAEAQATVVRLENKAKKQDKAIKFLFKDNNQLKRKLEESSSRSQGKALRDLCDRNDRLDAENRQLRERYAALAVKANGGSEYAPNNTRTTTSSSATRSTACSSSPGSPGLDPSPVQPTQAPAPAIHRVASRRRNSSPPKRQSPTEPQQPPPIAALPRPASSRRRHSILGNGVREIPTSMLQAPPPEFDPDQHKHNGFGGDGLREEDDPILGKTFSVNTGPSPSSMADMAKNAGSVTKKRISRRRASMFT